uniref:Uncharacterized protein n=1 Tax=Tetraselmis sp. GSL018 TaxID=582737 RepID=A0A061RLD4_9CHLO|mmetsp:Transcript_242/g.474  ORF Transcript_242/g.474 Transcript_242/m.474 type:complete len:464 (+) Transcript_242:288-1679(+)
MGKATEDGLLNSRHLLLATLFAFASMLYRFLPTVENSEFIYGENTWPMRTAINETARLVLFWEMHGAWPDQQMQLRESPTYSKVMAERTNELKNVEDLQDRWDKWITLAQARVVHDVTPEDWRVVDVPSETFSKAYTRLHEIVSKTTNKTLKTEQSVQSLASALHQTDLSYEILHDLKLLFSEWVGMSLLPTSARGFHFFPEGYVEEDHVDPVESEVVSGILHVDSDTEEPFPLQILQRDGQVVSVNTKPGQLIMFQGSKRIHGYTNSLRGRFFASISLGYRPESWNVTRMQVMAAIPPWWDASEQPSSEEAEADGNSSKAEFTAPSGQGVSVVLPEPEDLRSDEHNHSVEQHVAMGNDTDLQESPAAVDGVESDDASLAPIMMTFVNDGNVPVVLYWVVPGSEATSDDGRQQMQEVGTIPPGGVLPQTTFPGHEMVAVGQGVARRWAIEPRHNLQRLAVFGA